MRILVDVDGVLADLCSHLREVAGVRSEINKMHFGDCLTDLELLQIQQASSQRGFCLGIPWYPGAKNFLDDLNQMGKVYAVTAPWHLDTWASERAQWLSSHVPPACVLSVPTTSKRLVRGDVLIEDHPDTCRDWLDMNPDGLAILIDRPYNQEKDFPGCDGRAGLFRVFGYVEALHVIEGWELVSK